MPYRDGIEDALSPYQRLILLGLHAILHELTKPIESRQDIKPCKSTEYTMEELLKVSESGIIKD